MLAKMEYLRKKKVALNKKIEFLESTYQKLVNKNLFQKVYIV